MVTEYYLDDFNPKAPDVGGGTRALLYDSGHIQWTALMGDMWLPR
jgi:hypothetical protein